MGTFEGVTTFLPLETERLDQSQLPLQRARTAASERTAEEQKTGEVRYSASALKDSRED
jgi:hypothetical protein